MVLRGIADWLDVGGWGREGVSHGPILSPVQTWQSVNSGARKSSETPGSNLSQGKITGFVSFGRRHVQVSFQSDSDCPLSMSTKLFAESHQRRSVRRKKSLVKAIPTRDATRATRARKRMQCLGIVLVVYNPPSTP